MDALGSVISYVREDEQLQLSAVVLSEDLTPARLGAGVSAGVLFFPWDSLETTFRLMVTGNWPKAPPAPFTMQYTQLWCRHVVPGVQGCGGWTE